MATAEPPHSTTPALAPATSSSTKRLSTIKTSPSAAKAGEGAGGSGGLGLTGGAAAGAATGGAVGAGGAVTATRYGAGKEVLSPGELCGFVSSSCAPRRQGYMARGYHLFWQTQWNTT